ncbi:hypothetical protein SELMODRAFT_402086 [Selaginella moellendorffii]|uniref:Carboxypeptidase n=1 Tax=Selaginella moellendorffii TaxID=88036 RepID=D8QPJ2_SELML|nr:hypothetical protein SELMODRAFT_402086 [Selaginella moellendorffii]
MDLQELTSNFRNQRGTQARVVKDFLEQRVQELESTDLTSQLQYNSMKSPGPRVDNRRETLMVEKTYGLGSSASNSREVSWNSQPACCSSRQCRRLPFVSYHFTSIENSHDTPIRYDPCGDDYVEAYFNKQDVQQALHANVTGIPYNWTGCSETINTNWQDSDETMLPIYRKLMKAGLRIWVYSVDVDLVVPVTSSGYSVEELKLNTTKPWYPWY